MDRNLTVVTLLSIAGLATSFGVGIAGVAIQPNLDVIVFEFQQSIAPVPYGSLNLPSLHIAPRPRDDDEALLSGR